MKQADKDFQKLQENMNFESWRETIDTAFQNLQFTSHALSSLVYFHASRDLSTSFPNIYGVATFLLPNHPVAMQECDQHDGL